MNRSYSKIRHIQESNKILENRLMSEVDNVNCLKQSCINDLKKQLNNVRTSQTFRHTIDKMLSGIRTELSPESDQYKKDSDVLRKYLNYSEEKIKETMNIKMVYDENSDWVPINKLNTNYSDLSVLITDILIGEDYCICDLLDNLKDGDISFMLELRDKILENPVVYYEKYLKGKFDDYVKRNRENTKTGIDNELFAISEMEKFGYDLIYMASEGSPIDTLLGIDAIMSKDGEIYKIQVKTVNNLKVVEETTCDKKYPEIRKGKKKGGVVVYSYHGVIGVKENNIDYLILVGKEMQSGGQGMVVLRKYQPITVTLKPLECFDFPINKFPKPKGLSFIDHESIVHKTPNLNSI
jgi:hypothetical protein